MLRKLLMCAFLIAGLGAHAQSSKNSPVEPPQSIAAPQPLANDLDFLFETLNREIKNDPSNPELPLKKGIFLLDLGRLQEAAEVFETLRAQHPNHPTPYINLASVYAQQGRLEEARQMLMTADSLHAGRPQTQVDLAALNLGLALSALKKAQLAGASDPETDKKIQELEQLVAKLNEPLSSVFLPASSQVPEPLVPVERLRLLAPSSSASSTSPASPASPASRATPAMPLPKPKKIGATHAPARLGDRLKLTELAQDKGFARFPSSTDEVARRTPSSSGVSDEARADVMNTVESWAGAWSRRDVVDYTSYYSAKFKAPNGMNRDAWIKHKQAVMDRSSFIHVTVKIKKIKLTERRAFVEFSQRYRSDLHTDSVLKELQWVQEEGRWKIVSEKSI